MPRKKTEDETTNETVAEVGESKATDASSTELNAADEAQNTAGGENAEPGQDEHSISDSVIDMVSSAADTVSDGVSDIVSVVAGSSDEAADRAKINSSRAEKVGVVSSDKMTKTVVVRVDRVVKHPVYRKYVRRRKKFMAHDETGATIGDKVRIVETRPLSARKRWRVIEIIQKAEK